MAESPRPPKDFEALNSMYLLQNFSSAQIYLQSETKQITRRLER